MRTLLNTIALEPNRWTQEKIPAYDLLEDLLPAIARSQFRQLELWQYHLSGRPGAWLERLQKRARTEGFDFPILGVYPQFHLEEPQAGHERRLLFELLESARFLGCRWIKFFFGALKGNKITPAQLQLTTQRVSEWIRHGREQGLGFCAELHPGTLFDPVEFGLAYLDENPQLDIRICFQPYDWERTEPSLRLIDQLGPRIVHAHFQGRKGTAFTPLSGALVDYRRLIPALQRANPQFIPSVEFVPGGFAAPGARIDLEQAIAEAEADARFIEELLG